jgi:hypothetical protein
MRRRLEHVAEAHTNAAALTVLAAGVGGLLTALAILGPRRLKREIAYQRWRRSRLPQAHASRDRVRHGAPEDRRAPSSGSAQRA